VVAGTGEGTGALAERVEAFRRELIAARRGDARILPDVAEMRSRLAAAKGGDGGWDTKSGPGRLRDVELCAQGLALQAGSPLRSTPDQLAAGREAGLVGDEDAKVLEGAASLFWRVQAAARLLTEGTLDPDKVGEGGRRFLLRETREEAIPLLEARLAETAEAAAKVIDRITGGAP
jgi:glutamate-ammonia-ligase adenylyltransferase